MTKTGDLRRGVSGGLVLVLLLALPAPAQDLRQAFGSGEFAEDLKEAFEALRRGRRERARLKLDPIFDAGEPGPRAFDARRAPSRR